MSIAILTANMGAFDIVRTQTEQDVPVDWICVTDGAPAPEPWETIPHASSEAPRMAAKCVKLEPWRWVEHDYVLWVDSNTVITSPSFAREALRYLHDSVAMFAHPRRDCIYAEAQASIGAEGQNGKYDAKSIMEQVAYYRASGYPVHAGLYACGTVAWEMTDERARAFGSAWLAECERWSIQDQLSAPVVARALGIEPGVFPFAQVRRGQMFNKWLRIEPHA